MGKSTTPKYRVRIDGAEPMLWNIATYGRPTPENLERYVMTYAKSLEAGGCNEHISKELGHIPYPRKATIELNRSGPIEVITEWNAGMFQIYGDLVFSD